jgi:hypothetical protein
MSKYSVIIKANESKFLKYSHIDNLYLLSNWLDRHYPNWLYMNVYSNKTRAKIKSFTKYSKPYKNIVINE